MSNAAQVSRAAAVKLIEMAQSLRIMPSSTAIASALSGIQSGLRGLERSAHAIATGHGDRAEPVDLVEPLVDAIVYQHALEASANVLHRADEALGYLIDTFA